MLTGQLQIEIEAEPEIVFDLLADPTKVPIWNPNVIEASLLAERPIEKGCKGKAVGKSGRRRMEYEFIIYEYDRPKFVSIGITGGNEIGKVSYEFMPTEKGTEINYRFEYRFKGPLRLLEPFFKLWLLKRLLIKYEQKELEALKSHITKNK